jgi:hypothetical protein
VLISPITVICGEVLKGKLMKFKLPSFLPGFARKPGKSQPKPAPAPSVAASQSKQPAIPVPAPTPAPDPEPPNSTKAQKLLDDVCSFLARYLQCSPEQRYVLALWILHTHCFAAAKATPYLAIQSAFRLSGKTLCLRLLSLLCANPALTSGYTASTLVHRIHSHPQELPTFLLDECSATVGSGSRAKNPKLRSILASGFQPGIGYSDRSTECAIFSPKAFATMGPLPEPLSDCSLPIILRRLDDAEKNGIERFDLDRAREEAKPLVAALQNWARKNLATLKSAPALKRKDFPSRLTARGQDITEPLLQLADALSGAWPDRARNGLLAAFDDEDDQQRAHRIQLLRDIRRCFEHHNWPDGLHTRLLLEWLHALPARPWDADGPITDRKLAKMLRPHGICSTSVRMKSVAHGYRKNDFATPWNNLLDVPDQAQNQNQGPQPPSVTSAKPATTSIISNNDAACSAVTDARIIAPPAPPSPPPTRSFFPSFPGRPRNGNAPSLERHINGILEDTAHYFLEFPEQTRNILDTLIEKSALWPQPADDKGAPVKLLRASDGSPIPFTGVNRHPQDPEGRLHPYQPQNDRWPVMLHLNPQERLQVACARFYELHAAALANREKV